MATMSGQIGGVGSLVSNAFQSAANWAGTNFQTHSPITNALSSNGIGGAAARGFQLASRGLELMGCVPMWGADQLHQARLRLAFPNILKIPVEGINIGMGISIRRVDPSELGDISRPEWSHLRVLEVIGRRTGLQAFIGVHTLMQVNGRWWCIGGTRMRGDYPTRDHALRDVLRLSAAMTRKCAAADIPIGGGKCDITYNPKANNKDDVLHDFAKALEWLKLIFTGQDMNISIQNARLMGMISPDSIVGTPGLSMQGIEPTPPTANGVFVAIRKAAELHGLQMDGLRIALQGLGGVGSNLVPMLLESGAVVFATDVSSNAKDRVAGGHSSERLHIIDDPKAIYAIEGGVRVFSPSAIEDVVDDVTIPLLVRSGVKFIAGAANNPLADARRHADALRKKKIFYYADYVVNGGGLMGVASGVMGYDPYRKVATIATSVERLHGMMAREGLNGVEAGDRLINDRLASWHRMTIDGVLNAPTVTTNLAPSVLSKIRKSVPGTPEHP